MVFALLGWLARSDDQTAGFSEVQRLIIDDFHKIIFAKYSSAAVFQLQIKKKAN